jgi:predicted amidohydrolase YtcJ
VFEPYVDPRTGCDCGNGGLFVPAELLREAVRELDAVGFGVHFHAIGERAVHEALNAVAAARVANGRTPGRHHIAHLCLVHPNDIPRFAELDVTANLQPLWASDNPEVAEESLWVGPQRAQWWYPFGGLRRAGARLCAGSDWPVSSLDPLECSYVGVHRIDPGTAQLDQPVFLPDQRLTLTDMIDAYTAGSAYVNGLDDLTGRIGVGMLADLVLLDRDLLTAEHDPQTLGRVRLTLVDGRPAFDPASLLR